MNKENNNLSDLLKKYDNEVDNIINKPSERKNYSSHNNMDKEKNIIYENNFDNTDLSVPNKSCDSTDFSHIDNKDDKIDTYNYSNHNIDNNNDNNYHKSNKKIYFSFEVRLGIRVVSIIIFLIIFITLMIKYLSYNKNTNEYYSENSQSSYSVCLEKNDFYEESCLGEDRQYLTKLVDYIPYIFSYNTVYGYEVEKTYNYNVTAHLKIFSQDSESQLLYDKKFDITEKKEINDKNNVFTIADNVNIPFKEYQNLVTKYNNDYGVLSTSEVVIDFNVNDKSVSSITIPLGKQTFNITKRDTSNNILVDEEVKNDIQKTNILLLISLILSGLASIIFIIILIKFYFKYSNKKDEMTKYRNELKNILKNYDRIIVEVNDVSKLLENKVIIKVENFLELVDVRDTLDKPILHVKINSIKEGFYVEDNDKVYSFIMKAK